MDEPSGDQGPEENRRTILFLWTTGFLQDDFEDDTLKYDLVVKPKHEPAVLGILGWRSLEEGPDGEWLLTSEQVEHLSSIIEQPLPQNLNMFIGLEG